MNFDARFAGVVLLIVVLLIHLPESRSANLEEPVDPSFRAEILQVARDSPLIVTGEIRYTKQVMVNRYCVTILVSEIHRNVLNDIAVQSGQDLVVRMNHHPILHLMNRPIPKGMKGLWLLQLEGDGHFYSTRKDSNSCVASPKWSSWLLSQFDADAPIQQMSKWQWINRKPRKFNVKEEDWLKNLQNTVPIPDRLMEGGKFHRERLSDIQAQPLQIRFEIARMDQITARLDDDGWSSLKLFLLANDKSANVRSMVASRMGGVFVRERADIKAGLVEALSDTSSQVRMFACQSLKFCKDRSCPPVVASLLDDTDCEVRVIAVRTLGWIGSPKHVRDILRVYESREHQPGDEWVFADALSRLGEQKVSLNAAMKCMDSAQNNNWNVRYLAVSALEFNKSRAVVPALIQVAAMVGEPLFRICVYAR
ncbi:MAG: HEAT repeat domain-containing protein [Pirellulales bacterium]|nr:HEAT repeat domain-containing protein [Pirellulales bacterium]